jgi:hypothetical protein
MKKMNGRYFDGRRVIAYINNKGEKFNKTRNDTDEELLKRQEEYGAWLDSQNVE